MKIRKILLVNPPGSLFVQPDGTRQAKEIYLPVGLAYLASAARASGDYEIRIYDMVVEDYECEARVDGDTVRYGASYDRYREFLEEFDPDFVGISCILSSRSSFSLNLLKITKEYNSRIITAVGGHHASALPGSEMYDYCVRNDLLYDDFDITKVRYSNTFIRNENIPRAELEGVRKIVWERHFGANLG